jgi:GNAT superfamily N-acetyltransferase
MSIDAVERALRDAFLSYTALPDADAEQRPDLLSIRTRVPITFFNGIPYAAFDPGEADARVKEMIARYRETGVPFRWWILPSTAPANMIEILKANKFRHTFDAPGMSIDLAALPAQKSVEGLEIRRVDDAEMLRDWTNVFGEAFRRPEEERKIWHSTFLNLGYDKQWRHFVGYLDGEPVATSTICHRGDLAGVFHVATLAKARGRGIGSATTLQSLLHARDIGCRTAALQSSEMAFSVYRSMGFAHDCDLTLYDWRPEYEG